MQTTWYVCRSSNFSNKCDANTVNNYVKFFSLGWKANRQIFFIWTDCFYFFLILPFGVEMKKSKAMYRMIYFSFLIYRYFVCWVFALFDLSIDIVKYGWRGEEKMGKKVNFATKKPWVIRILIARGLSYCFEFFAHIHQNIGFTTILICCTYVTYRA